LAKNTENFIKVLFIVVIEKNIKEVKKNGKEEKSSKKAR